MPNSIVFKNKQKLFHYTNNFQLRKFVLLMLRMNAKQVGFLFAQFLIKDAVLRVFCNNKNKLVCIFFVAISTISKCPIWQSLLPISEFVLVKKFLGNISNFSIWKTKVAFSIFHFVLLYFFPKWTPWSMSKWKTKRKKIHGFSYDKSMANFEAFH